MNRREALFQTAGLLGGTLVGPQLLLPGCAADAATGAISPTGIPFMDEVAETILPATDGSGGAQAAGVGAFMQIMLRDCYDEAEAETVYGGLQDIEDRAQDQHGRGFPALSPQERFALIDTVDREARAAEDHYFAKIKDLVLWGYFSSEVGCREALRFNPIPGRFDGCIPYHNEPAWTG